MTRLPFSWTAFSRRAVSDSSSPLPQPPPPVSETHLEESTAEPLALLNSSLHTSFHAGAAACAPVACATADVPVPHTPTNIIPYKAARCQLDVIDPPVSLVSVQFQLSQHRRHPERSRSPGGVKDLASRLRRATKPHARSLTRLNCAGIGMTSSKESKIQTTTTPVN